jgi:hypothetical protein
MTIGVRGEITNPPGLSGARAERRARRIEQLYASDAQFRAANPVLHRARGLSYQLTLVTSQFGPGVWRSTRRMPVCRRWRQPAV